MRQPGDDSGRGRRGRPSRSYAGVTVANELAQTLSDLAQSLQNEDGLADTVDGIVAAAVQTVPGAERAGVMVVHAGRTIETRSATDDVVREVDRAQFDAGQGPCMDAIHQQRTVRVDDMAGEKRWPQFTRRALDLGVCSMLSFQLYVVRDNLGALTLYSDRPHAFGDESEDVGLLFASHAAVALIGARNHEQMASAVSARDLIGQAKGILMERHRLDADHAFALLVRASQRTNTKLAEIARRLTETGELAQPRARAN